MANMDNPNATRLIVAALIQRLGGKVELTQEEVDKVSFGLIGETITKDGIMLEYKAVPEEVRATLLELLKIAREKEFLRDLLDSSQPKGAAN